MYDPTQCPKCGYHDTVMMLFGYVCNRCEPAKAGTGVKKQAKVKYYYGWIPIGFTHDGYATADEANRRYKRSWSPIFNDLAEIKAVYGPTMKARRVKTLVPYPKGVRNDPSTGFVINAEHFDALDRGLPAPTPTEEGIPNRIGWCKIVEDDEGT